MSTQTGANIKKLALIPSGTHISSFAYAIAPGGANETVITITAKDAAGNTIANVHNFDLSLSDAATGAGLTAVTASGAVTTTTGAVFHTMTAKKALRIQTAATGIAVLSITDTAKTGFYVAAFRPIDGKAVVSRQLLTADYA